MNIQEMLKRWCNRQNLCNPDAYKLYGLIALLIVGIVFVRFLINKTGHEPLQYEQASQAEVPAQTSSFEERMRRLEERVTVTEDSVKRLNNEIEEAGQIAGVNRQIRRAVRQQLAR